MTPTEVFSMANGVALIMWLLMIVLPNWKITRRLIDYKVIPILLSILYIIYLIISMVDGPSMDFGSLQAVMELFTQENAVLAGWIHYLVFDMLIGMWMLEQNKQLKIHGAIMIPVLIATLMMGPVGFLLFIGVKSYIEKKGRTVQI